MFNTHAMYNKFKVTDNLADELELHRKHNHRYYETSDDEGVDGCRCMKYVHCKDCGVILILDSL